MVTSYGYFKCGSIPADVIAAVWGGRGSRGKIPHSPLLVVAKHVRPSLTVGRVWLPSQIPLDWIEVLCYNQ